MKKVPDVEISVDGKKCINLKRMLCCNSECLENDTVISNCCIIQNITNDKEHTPKPPVGKDGTSFTGADFVGN